MTGSNTGRNCYGRSTRNASKRMMEMSAAVIGISTMTMVVLTAVAVVMMMMTVTMIMKMTAEMTAISHDDMTL